MNLAQLLALVQDNIQRSYEHAEDLARMSANGSEVVTMAVESLELDLPIICSAVEQTVDLNKFAEETKGSSAFELAELRISAPKLSRENQLYLRRTMVQKHITNTAGPHLTTSASKAKIRKTKTEKSTPVKQEVAPDLRVKIFDSLEVTPELASIIPRLSVKFRTTIK